MACGSDRDVDHAAVLVAPLPLDETRRLQPIDQPGDAGHDGDHPRGDLQDRQRPPLAPEDAEDVVLLGRQAKLPEQTGEPDLQLIRRPQHVQHRLLLRQVERFLLLDFALQGNRHEFAPIHRCGFSVLYRIIDMSTIAGKGGKSGFRLIETLREHCRGFGRRDACPTEDYTDRGPSPMCSTPSALAMTTMPSSLTVKPRRRSCSRS